jgi:hypothetical protein
MMFRVELGVVLVGKDRTMGLSRWLRLPFAPFPGLELYGLTADPDRTEQVVGVTWDVSQGCFYVELLDRHAPDQPISALIDSYGRGWELHEPGSEVVPEDS